MREPPEPFVVLDRAAADASVLDGDDGKDVSMDDGSLAFMLSLLLFEEEEKKALAVPLSFPLPFAAAASSAVAVRWKLRSVTTLVPCMQ